ncbi:MAG: endolytic transglycosylase MltG [Tenuifilum sp.]|uniref:endolytic transglycosylase MltG n=1 Tax=Tenuifilum sp. TaxID=2760880 RepID=UPI00309E480A
MKKFVKFGLVIALVGLAIGVLLLLRLYFTFRAPNVAVPKETLIYIPTGSNYNDVLNILANNKVLKSIDRFKRVAQYYDYEKSVKPGCYAFKPGMSNSSMVKMLKYGHQKPVKVTFTGMRTWQQLAQRISSQIEADSVSLINLFTSDSVAFNRGFTPSTFMAMFIPNTYEFYWNTHALGFINRMYKEYNRFWNESRIHKADGIGLSPVEVAILASIVEEETNVKSEMPIIAGVYLNRLRKGIPLQADPTVKFAIGDFTIRRVLTRHLAVDSPFNTYKHRGLPPGPIRIPSVIAIDAVLNAQKHSYLYFCASPDFSGRHIFAQTLAEHNRNAAEYRRALNKERIYR